MNSPTLGFGIVGTGLIAAYHARAIADSGQGRLVAVLSRSLEQAEAFALRHGAAIATDQSERFFSLPELEAVCIATPSGAHLEPALAAIAAGKHLVIEKPLEITLQRADALLEAAERAGLAVMPIFQARFAAGAQKVKEALGQGRLGKLVFASASVKWHRSPTYYTGWKGTLALDGGGAVINQAIHALDLLQWFAGLPEEVFAWKTRCVHQGIEAEDTACASLRFPCGALGTFEASTAVWPGWSRRVELCGARGSLCLEDEQITRWDFQDERPEDTQIQAGCTARAAKGGASAPQGISHLGHLHQIQGFIAALQAGRTLPLDGREGRKALALVQALYTSARTGQSQRL